MKFGFRHEIFDVFGPGVGNCKVFDPDVLAYFSACCVENGADGRPREVISSIFYVYEYPVCGSVLERRVVGRGGV